MTNEQQEEREFQIRMRHYDAQIANLNAQTDKLLTEHRHYLAVTYLTIGAAITLAAVGVVSLILT